MLIITTVFVSHVEPQETSEPGAMPEAVNLGDLPRIIESKLMEDPDPNRKLVIVYAGTTNDTH
jgi:hypothetical protein